MVYEATAAADAVFPKGYEAFAVAVLEALRQDDPSAMARTLTRVGDAVHRWLESLVAEPLTRVRCMRRGEPFSEYRLGAS